jgi:capsular exopolysaccharide synthesis family protein
MSRIYEALQKAQNEHRNDQPSSVSVIEEMIRPRWEAAPQKETVDRGPVLSLATRKAWSPEKKRMPFFDEADSIGKEQFRTLRSRLYQLREQRKLSALLISSAMAEEGKSFTAANLAHVFALQPERRVVLVDCDLRRGSLASFLGAPHTPGLSEYLNGECALEEVLQAGGAENFFLLPCGSRVQQPGELIASPRMAKLVEQLRARFDWVIVDTPPATLFSDASVLADLCDGVLLVVKSGATPIRMAKNASLEFKKKSLLGVVLNKSAEVLQDSSYYAYATAEA